MKQFSHSKLQIYERCPLQFKFEYLTNLKPEKEDTIEAFTGSRVHETLELLYRDLLKTKLNSLKELLKFYEDMWKVQWTNEIVINDKKFKKKHYFDLGKKCVESYYERYYPFDQDQTVGIEKKINLQWGDLEIIGYIDRLSKDKNGIYYVRDYKTGAIMDQEYADKDRQLALYSIWVRNNFKDAKDVKLVWHFVAFDEEVVSARTGEQLKELKKDILSQITQINKAEEDDNFPAHETKCEWCGFWAHCPRKKHLFKTKKLSRNEYLKDNGVKLAQKYIDLAERKSRINKQTRTDVELINEDMEKIEEAILKYAEKHKVEVLNYGELLVAINKKKDYSFPTKSSSLEKYEALESLLKKSKYWNEVSSVNAVKIAQLLEDSQVDLELKKQIIMLAPLEETTRFSIRKK